MAAVDLSTLVTAVNFSSTTVAVIAVCSVLVGVFVTIAAALYVMGMVSGKVYYGGQWWDKDVYQTALSDVKRQSRAGHLVDAESRRAVDHFEGKKSSRSGGSNRIPSMRI